MELIKFTNMTKAFLTLSDYEPLGAKKGDLLIQSEESAEELGMSQLKEFKQLTEQESLAYYKQQATKN